MTETQCSKQIYANWSRHPCSRKGIVEREGKFYCKQHDPVRIKDQEEKQNRKWDQEWAEAKAKRDHINACVRAIESIGGDPETVGELREALKKALTVGGTEHPYAFNMCYWCSSAEDDPHEDNCVYMAALTLLAKTKVEL